MRAGWGKLAAVAAVCAFDLSGFPAVHAQERSLHVALLGDSLSTSFYLGDKSDTIQRAQAPGLEFQNWFLDSDESPQSIFSFVERLSAARAGKISAANYSRVGAFVSGLDIDPGFKEWVLKSRSLSQQALALGGAGPLPELVLVWIGHNNVDYRMWPHLDGISLEALRRRFRIHARVFAHTYLADLQPLISRAEGRKAALAIVVLGLVNFESFFQARGKIEAFRKAGTYPFLEASETAFPSMMKYHRTGMVELATLMNQALRKAVAERATNLPSHIRLVYSDALAVADIGAPADLRAEDAWHPSIKGHGILARQVFESPEFADILTFLDGAARRP